MRTVANCGVSARCPRGAIVFGVQVTVRIRPDGCAVVIGDRVIPLSRDDLLGLWATLTVCVDQATGGRLNAITRHRGAVNFAADIMSHSAQGRNNVIDNAANAAGG